MFNVFVSTRSGTSVVSVLSNLSLASGLSNTEGGRSSEKQSSFAIGGLEHTLLSRGTVTAKSELEEGGGGHNAGEFCYCCYLCVCFSLLCLCLLGARSMLAPGLLFISPNTILHRY